MLIEIKVLDVQNEGYKRKINLEKMYVNSASVVSIIDYHGAQQFLLRENSSLSKEKFSLVRLNEGGSSKEIIAFGSAEQLYSMFNTSTTGKRLLND